MTEPAVRQRWALPNAMRVATIFLAIAVLLLFFWRARSLFLTTFLGVIFGLALARAADFLEKHRVRRSIGAPVVMLIVVGALAVTIALIAPRLREQTRDLSKQFPKALQAIEQKLGIEPGTVTAVVPGAQQPQKGQGAQGQQQKPQQAGALQQAVQREMRSVGRLLFPFISSSVEAVAGLLIMVFIAIYIAISPHTYRDGLLHLIPHSRRARAEDVLDEVGETLRGWLTARLIAVVIIGVITGAGLAMLRVKGALALGLIAGLLEFIPFFGPIISSIPAIAIAMLDTPQKAIYVILLYIAIQQLEGNIVTPLLLKRRLDVPPVLTIVAVSALGLVFGVLGMLTAEPLVAVTLVLVKRLYVEDVVGDDTGD
jgi:predicted PurR-regulated permease PerM